MTTTTTIINQLGGNKFVAMTGATFFSKGQNTLISKFKGSKIANIMYITLDADDTYTVKICKFRGLNETTVKELSGVYFDMLKPIFENTTKLRTSL